MVKAPAFLLLSLALAGCAVAPQAHLASDPAFKPARYVWDGAGEDPNRPRHPKHNVQDRKSTRLNSSHMSISYAVFCLKKKKNNVSARLLWAIVIPALT